MVFLLTFTVSREARPEICWEAGSLVGTHQTISLPTPELANRVEAEVAGAAADPAVLRRGDFPADFQRTYGRLPSPLA